MKSSKRKFEPQSLKQVLAHIVEDKALNAGINNTRVNALWYELMGAHMTRYTDKIMLKENTLFVSLNNAALREELSYGKDKIIKMMNDELGKVLIEKIILR